MNIGWALRALQTLKESEFNSPERDSEGIRAWLHPLDAEVHAGNARYKWTLLAELGRMSGQDASVILDIADYVCLMHRYGSTVKDCIRMIRNARTDPEFLRGIVEFINEESA